MSTLTILFVLPLLIIFSYLFDAFAKKTKFPSVILLMATGIIIRILVSFTDYENFSFLENLIPVLGTLGLILIVLEGAIELDITVEKLPLILKGFFCSLYYSYSKHICLESNIRISASIGTGKCHVIFYTLCNYKQRGCYSFSI